eukprot:tig00000605_g2490.t1
MVTASAMSASDQIDSCSPRCRSPATRKRRRGGEEADIPRICPCDCSQAPSADPRGIPGSHQCFFVRGGDEYASRVAGYFAHGLRRGEKIRGLIPARRRDFVLLRLCEEMGDASVSSALASGRLSFMEPVEGYLEPPDEAGRRLFSGEAVLHRMQDGLAASLAEGYTGLRVAGDMGWICAVDRAVAGDIYEDVRTYEARITDWMAGAGGEGAAYTAMCIFDMDEHPAQELLDILFVHPTVWCRGSDDEHHEHRNMYFVPPEESAQRLQSSKLELILSNLERWERNQRELLASYARLEEANRALAATIGRLTAEIAERKAVEAALEANQRQLLEAKRAADCASRCKSEFLCTMSHELRTPLSSVIMCAEELRASCTPQQEKDVSTILTCGSHLLTLISDILDLSKVEQGKLELERRAFPLRRVVEDALRVVACRAHDTRAPELPRAPRLASLTAGRAGRGGEQRDAALVGGGRGGPEALEGDEVRLRQILVNLLSNAVKFTRGGAVRLRVAPEGPAVRFEVLDQGIGIAADRLERIWDRFSQADASTTREARPPPPPLHFRPRPPRPTPALARSSGHGARAPHRRPPGPTPTLPRRAPLTPAAQLGAGSTFTVLLPRAVVGAEQAPPPPPPLEETPLSPQARASSLPASPEGLPRRDSVSTEAGAEAGRAAPLRVLLCDDNSVNQARAHHRRGPRPRLTDPAPPPAGAAAADPGAAGYDVEVASDGLEAVAACRRARFDVCLMDIQMPRLDGIEATRRILEEARAPGAHPPPPFIALTAAAMQETRGRCMRVGMVGFLSKPITRDKLQEAIRAALQGAPPPPA